MQISFRREAEHEILDAREWYNARLPGLGDVFSNSVDQAVTAILSMPSAHPRLGKQFRHIMLRKFPFSLVYMHQRDEIIVLSCFHHRRRPGRWHR